MKTKAVLALVLVGALWSVAPAQFAEPGKEFDKTGQAGMTFLKIGPLARAAGMGDAYTSLSVGASSAFYNPAGLGFLDGKFEVLLGRVNWMADIAVSSASVGVPLRIGKAGRVAVVGFSVVSMDYGDIYGTVIDRSAAAQFRDVGKLEPTESALGLTLAKQFTDKFSLGVTVKYVTQSLPWYATGGRDVSPDPVPQDAKAGVLAFDGGTLYRTGFGSSVISMSIRNFARSQVYERDRLLLPMTFSIGLAADVLDLAPGLQRAGHRLMVSGDGLHPPDHPEKFAIGGEYSFRELVFLRGGYSFNCDVRTVSLGAGLRYSYAGFRGAFDYAYSNFGTSLGSVNYFTFTFGMD